MSKVTRIRLGIAVLVLGTAVPAALAWNRITTAGRSSGSPLTLRAAPATETVAPDARARYLITIRRRRWTGLVSLVLRAGLPARARAWLRPVTTYGTHATLFVVTSASTPPGNYRLRVGARGKRRSATATIALIVSSRPGDVKGTQLNFGISGSVSAIEPGVARPLNLSLSNPNQRPLSLTLVTVGARAVTAPHATRLLPCTLADFAIWQFSGSYPIAVPASSTLTLSSLGIPSARWPQVAMLDRPVSQNGCIGASLALSYSATGSLR